MKADEVVADDRISRGVTIANGHLALSREWKIPCLILLGFFIFYTAMFLRYRPYDVDNPWFLSFSYNACVNHINKDVFMNVRFPGGMDGTQFFGKLASYTQCAVLLFTGWQQRPAAVLASTFMTLSLAMWWLQLRRLGYAHQFIHSFIIVVGLSEPFVSAATKFRYEFFSFSLVSLALLFVSYRKIFWGMFVAVLAIETQPMALAGVIPVVALACSIYRVTRSLFARLALGATLAVAVYLALHRNIVHFTPYLSQVNQQGLMKLGGFFSAYFLQRSRHIPELVCFLVAGVLYWRKRDSIRCHYLAISAAAISVFSVLMPHGNTAYAIFLYPFLVAVAMIAFQAEKRSRLIVVTMCIYVLPQYAYLAYINRGQGYSSQDIQQVSSAIQDADRQLGLSDDKLKIYGDYGLWFAHPHHYRAASIDTVENLGDANLYLCYDHPFNTRSMWPEGMFFCDDLRKRMPLHLLSTTLVRNNVLYLYTQ